ncbi:MAG TPA: efflux RND transporter periplasmic adaptor subunit [Rhodothermales bacterium]|nr:efflux RND transporter periplasmic adaptor subunit [Rhodothermales bacterium]
MKNDTTMKKKLLIITSAVVLLAAAGFVLFKVNSTKLAAAAVAGGGTGDSTGAGPGAGGLAAYDKDGDGIVYQDGMHPWIVEDAPGPSPDGCGMNLTPVRVDGAQEAGTVRIDPVTIQNIGVRTAPVMVEALGRTVRTTGRFEANERGLSAVAPKVGGWVEKLYVEYEGARVRRGQPLLEIYSPDLVSTQEEYLLALRNAERLRGGMGAADAQRLVEAALRRLAYWDISEAQIERLKETGRPQKTLTLYAPASGTVTTKNVVEGQQIAPGQTLMELADLSRLWLMVDVYEQDLAWVRVGTPVRVELPYEPGRTLTGRVDYLYDDLDPQTRTVKARVTIPNPGLQLKPGMYATVYLTGGEAQPAPTVPSEAVIRTGEREVVILALGEGRFRPQEVVTGVGADGKVQVLQGLSGGEQVVTSAQFLIDSEARLRSALSAMVSSHSLSPNSR